MTRQIRDAAKRAAGGLLLAAALAGCSRPATEFERDADRDFSAYRVIGVADFTDRRGEGRRIAEGIEAGLKAFPHGTPDRKALEEVLAKHKPDRDFGWGLEALAVLRQRTSADALLFGSMTPDWSQVSITMIETQDGGQILRGTLRPAGKGQKAFRGPDEVVAETLVVLRKLLR